MKSEARSKLAMAIPFAALALAGCGATTENESIDATTAPAFVTNSSGKAFRRADLWSPEERQRIFG
jgi:hypothetical protein